MTEFWKHAIKFTGIGGVVFFVLWYLFKDIIAKFTSLTSEQSFILGGLIIVLLALLGSKAMDKSTNNRSVKIEGNSTGNIATGDGNSINSTEKVKLRINKEEKSSDRSVNVGGDSSGNIVTGDGNSIG